MIVPRPKPKLGSMFVLSAAHRRYSTSLFDPGLEVMLRLDDEVLCGLSASCARLTVDFHPWGRDPITVPLDRIREAAPLPAHTVMDRCEATLRQRNGLGAFVEEGSDQLEST